MGNLFTSNNNINDTTNDNTLNLKLPSVSIAPISAAPVSSAPASVAPVSIEPTFESKMLELHNVVREKNGLQKFTWDPALQQRAAEWGKQLQSGKCSEYRHPGTGENGTQAEIDKYLPDGNGQNLYQGSGVKVVNGVYTPYDNTSGSQAVRKWYNECNIWKKPLPDQEIPDRFMEVGHMTQLLWRDASKVGCSKVDCTDKLRNQNGVYVPTKGSIIVCNYDKGNIGGEFLNEVPDSIYCLQDNTWIN